jgi:hypothetical protein
MAQFDPFRSLRTAAVVVLSEDLRIWMTWMCDGAMPRPASSCRTSFGRRKLR